MNENISIHRLLNDGFMNGMTILNHSIINILTNATPLNDRFSGQVYIFRV